MGIVNDLYFNSHMKLPLEKGSSPEQLFVFLMCSLRTKLQFKEYSPMTLISSAELTLELTPSITARHVYDPESELIEVLKM